MKSATHEMAQKLARKAEVSVYPKGSFTFVCVEVKHKKVEYRAFDFSKCALSFDDYDFDKGVRIAVNRCLHRIARAVKAGTECFEEFEAWSGKTDYGMIG